MVISAACSSDDEPSASSSSNTTVATPTTVAAADLAPIASHVTDLLVANDWAGLRTMFNAAMAAGQSEEGLETGWKTIVDMYGAYKSHGVATSLGVVNGESTWQTPITFGSKAMAVRVSFDAAGKVAALNILEA